MHKSFIASGRASSPLLISEINKGEEIEAPTVKLHLTELEDLKEEWRNARKELHVLGLSLIHI